MITNNLSLLMGKKKMKIAELCRLTNLSYIAVFNLYHEKSKGIDFKTLDKICEVLECNTQDLLEFAPNKN